MFVRQSKLLVSSSLVLEVLKHLCTLESRSILWCLWC